MNAQELRLGNLVKDRAGKVIRIDFFDFLHKAYSCKFGQMMFLDDEEVHPMTEYTDYAEPIPLTEEWLLKLGFIEKKPWFFEIKMGDYELGINRIPLTAQIQSDGEFLAFLTNRTKYVHQLQNLYFAITGEELKIAS
jgi:hypothetical protein